MTKKTTVKKAKNKKRAAAVMPKPSGIPASITKITSTDGPVVTVTIPPKNETCPESLPLVQDINLQIREADGAVYARVTKLCQNKRLVIVSPFNKEFRSGRMTIPARGAGKKLAVLGRKLWVIPVRDGVYQCAGLSKRYG